MKNPRKQETKPQNYLTIGVDASRALTEQKTGTEHYSASLLEALARLPEAQHYKAILYVNSISEVEARGKLGFEPPTSWQIRAIPFPQLWTHARLSVEMITGRPDVLFVPSHVVPLLHPQRTVVTIHDLGYLYYPQAHTRGSRFYLHISTLFSVRAARQVIAISEATKHDLVDKYKVPNRKIKVIYHGRDPLFQPVSDQAKIRDVAARYGVAQPYCLHVGTLQPRKNLGLLIETWDALRQTMENPPQLLLAGRRGWLYSSLLESIRAKGLGDLIKLADYVERDDLPALYSGAVALTFPSLYEGFGLPPLEAMSCGTPVLASNSSSLPEVVGNAGILLDPHDPAAWTDALRRVISDPQLRAEMSRKGLERAAQFTWEKCATETLALLTSI
ncbi:MAG: glycosyltransferase family 1 protein [Chloroflexia bacterium]